MFPGGAYEPRVLEGTRLPLLVGSNLRGEPFVGIDLGSSEPIVCVGGFHVDSLIEQDVWRRLLESTDAVPHQGVIQSGWSSAQRRELEEAVPISRHGRTWAWTEADAWYPLIAPDRPDRSFALCAGAGTALLVVGKPNESVWERFLDRLQTLRTGG